MSAETRGRTLAGVAAIAATYAGFLLHAQFALLALVERAGQAPSTHGAGAPSLRAVMASMGLAGLAASLAAGALLRVVPARRLILTGLLGCAAVELLSLAARGAVGSCAIAALVGAFTAILTVSIAASLPSLVPGSRLGLKAGLGTGAAYLLANVPALFHGGPVVQSIVSAIAGVIAAILLVLLGSSANIAAPGPSPPAARRGALLALATLTAGFLALVWLDSAAFRIVQETASLQDASWGPGSRTILQGVTHLAGAIAAGFLLDRGHLRSILLGTFALFAAAFPLLMHGLAIGGPLYAIGIAAYSTALVVAPSMPASGDALPTRWRAAILYAVAGWLGSALGIGMAQDLHRVPPAFTLAAGAVLVAGALLSDRASLVLVRQAAAAALVLAAAGALVARPAAPRAGETSIERGRRVYVAEGCIQCHSQYVRPASVSDVAAWGPARRDQLGERPPLIGTRRIGPDLLAVGTRRDATWNRLHLIDPRALAPASSMPSYAHLFGAGESRGEDLVAYLGSLGAATLGDRLAATRAAPMPRIDSADRALGRRVFAASCAPCHGAEGHGDGPLAEGLSSPFLDLRLPGLPRVDRVTGDVTLDLERVVRFGIPGTPMAGHELLTDAELAAVVARVLEIRGEAAP